MSEKPGLGHKEKTWTTWNAQHGMESIGREFGIAQGGGGVAIPEGFEEVDMGLNAELQLTRC